MVVEICANSFRSARNAEKAGADRIELCTELATGGLTPSYGLLKQVISKLSIPVYVLIRHAVEIFATQTRILIL